MQIHALTVCKDYAPQLAIGLEFWNSYLASWTIVTDFEDKETEDLAAKHGLNLYKTDALKRFGADFNKGLAQEEAWDMVPKSGWILLLDADVYPQCEMWYECLCKLNLEPGYLYGCWRYDEQGRRLGDDTHGYGYFQLFAASDLKAQIRPFFDTFWRHAGNGDSNIMLRWRDVGKLAPVLPFGVVHPGGPNHNWLGIGQEKRFKEMIDERRRRGGGWKSLEGERLSGN